MDSFLLNTGYLATVVISLIVLLGCIVVIVYALVILLKSTLSTPQKLFWGIAILGLPGLGAAAYLVMHTRGLQHPREKRL